MLPVEVGALVSDALKGAPSIRALSSAQTWAGVRVPPNEPVTRPGMVIASGLEKSAALGPAGRPGQRLAAARVGCYRGGSRGHRSHLARRGV